jgi:hypothetical protein
MVGTSNESVPEMAIEVMYLLVYVGNCWFILAQL